MVFLLAFTLSIMLYFPYMNSKKPFITLAVLLITLLTSSITYATLAPLTPPPVGGYDSGTNSILDPGCAPNAVDCVVNLPTPSSSGWGLSGNTIASGIPSAINTVFTGTGLDDITMTGPYTGTTTSTWVFVITATGTPDQMEVIIDGDSEYIGDVFPPGPLPVDDGLTINFGSDTGHTVGDTWTFTMTPAGTTSAFLGTLNNEDLVFKTNNTEWLRLTSTGNLTLANYTTSRDDSGTNFPTNFLYTDGSGNLAVCTNITFGWRRFFIIFSR
jgi:hypothetical protein